MAVIDNLVSFWELEEASGVRADAHGPNDLTPVFGIPGSTAGLVGDAMATASGHNGVACVHHASLSPGNGDYTWMAWVRAPSWQLDGGILTNFAGIAAKFWPDPTSFEYVFEYSIEHGSKFALFVYEDGSTSTDVLSAISPSPNTWHLVVAYHDATADEIGISVDAGAFETEDYSAGIHVNASAPLFVGRHPFVNTVQNGVLYDQIGMWARKLSQPEIDWLYNERGGRSYAEIVAGMGGGDSVPLAMQQQLRRRR